MAAKFRITLSLEITSTLRSLHRAKWIEVWISCSRLNQEVRNFGATAKFERKREM